MYIYLFIYLIEWLLMVVLDLTGSQEIDGGTW